MLVLRGVAGWGAPRPAEFRRARPWVGEALFRGRTEWFRRCLAVMARAHAVAEGRFDQAVLAAVEADDRGPPPFAQAERQAAQQRLEVRQFAVDQDAQRLEGARRGVQVPAAGGRVQAPRLA